ncbi:MAG: hypothetical protein ACERKN_17600 [Velocimicrobium sp.]
MGKKKINGLKVRLVISALIFLLIFTLNQITETRQWLHTLEIQRKIASFEDIYRLEDECILWYNSFAEENK